MNKRYATVINESTKVLFDRRSSRSDERSMVLKEQMGDCSTSSAEPVLPTVGEEWINESATESRRIHTDNEIISPNDCKRRRSYEWMKCYPVKL